MSLVLLFLYLMLNIFRMLIHPSSGACDLCVDLFHGLYWFGSMCVGVTLWFGCGGVVSVCRLTYWCLLFHYLMLNMFRMLIHPSSGACDLFVELFHELYCSGSMCVDVTLWFGWGGVVWYPYAGWGTSGIRMQAEALVPQPSYGYRKLLRMDVLISETCWALNNEIIKQLTSSWSFFIQLSTWCTVQ